MYKKYLVAAMPLNLDNETLNQALLLLAERLRREGEPGLRLVVCGGSALVALGLVPRATKDVDVVALMDERGGLISPDPLPPGLLTAARQVADILDLEEDWLNNRPSSGKGGLYQLGLPDGLASRLMKREYGENLTVWFVGRLDQIHFKLYAAVDRGGYHVQDLMALNPTPEEMERAARWAMSHDVSEEFRSLLKSMLRQLGYEDVAERL